MKAGPHIKSNNILKVLKYSLLRRVNIRKSAINIATVETTRIKLKLF